MSGNRNKRTKATKSARAEGRQASPAAPASTSSFAHHFGAALAEPISKFGQVIAAVTLALEDDRNWPPNDRSAVMGTTYRYSIDTLRMFLVRVHNTLANGTPSHQFDATSVDPQDALGMTVEQLMAAIYEQTN